MFYKHLCSTHEGHLNAVYKIFRYLQKNLSKNPVRILFYTYFVHIYEKVFKGSTIELEDWKNFYPDAEEDRLRKNLKPLG